MKGERIIVFEHLDERELPVRETAPTVEIAAWRGCGAERGEYEAAVEVEYLRPTRRAA
jgi:hypothetical protein